MRFSKEKRGRERVNWIIRILVDRLKDNEFFSINEIDSSKVHT